jgi:hypothetical protein
MKGKVVANDSSQSTQDEVRINEWTFQNLQRIASDNATARLTVLGLMFSLNPLGGAGLYALAQENNTKSWIIGLCSAMFLVSVALTLIHWREHNLFKTTIKKLEEMKVGFPEECKCWRGVTWNIIQLLYISTIGWWIVAFFLFGLA